MKTNSEAKQEVIQQKWVEAGFVWSEIEQQIDKNGLLFTEQPDNLGALTGYNEALANCELKWLGSQGNMFFIELSSIEGIEKNNGWIRIEPDKSNLPTENILVDILEKTLPRRAWYRSSTQEFTDTRHYYLPSHYKPVKDQTLPIY